MNNLVALILFSVLASAYGQGQVPPDSYGPEMPASDREINIVRMVARDLVLGIQYQRLPQLPPFNYIGVASFRIREDATSRLFLFRLQLSPTNEDWGALIRLDNAQMPILLRAFPLQFGVLEEPQIGAPFEGPIGPEGVPLLPEQGIPGQGFPQPMDQGGFIANQPLQQQVVKRENQQQQYFSSTVKRDNVQPKPAQGQQSSQGQQQTRG